MEQKKEKNGRETVKDREKNSRRKRRWSRKRRSEVKGT